MEVDKDAGDGPGGTQVAVYRCKCGWDSGWIEDNRSDSEMRRGMPCRECNEQEDRV